MAEISIEELLRGILPMFEGHVQDPKVFVESLRAFHTAEASQRGHLANGLSELIIGKRVDLAEVRHLLIEGGEADLLDTLDRLLDLIEPYIEEGGVDE